MPDETQTETTDETPADIEQAEPVPVEPPADQPETPSAPASGGGAGGGSGTQSTGGADAPPVDIDAAFAAKDALIEKFAAGVISAEDYAQETAKHDKAILKAQRELAKPAQQVQQTYQEQKAAQDYWQNWGKGQDVGQLTYGKTVKAERAAALYREAEREVQANPRYRNRKEFDTSSIAYDKWMDKLEAESKRKPPAATTPTPQTRVSGDVPVSQSGGNAGRRMTAREKLEAGEYDLG